MKSAFSLCFLVALLSCSKCQQTGILGRATQTAVPIGTMYGKTTWANLTDFETSGTAFSVSGGVIRVASDASATSYIRLPHATQLDKEQFQMVDTIKTIGTSTGVGLEGIFESLNTTVVASLYGGLITETGNANYGKAFIRHGYTNTFYYSTALPLIAAGDVIRITLSKDKALVSCLAENLTKGTSATVSFTNTFAYGDAGMGHNTAKVTLRNSGTGTYSITSLTYSSTQTKGGAWTFGDSIAEGSYAGSAANRWPELLGIQISAGGGDKTAELVARQYEMTIIIQPEKAYIAAGINDIFQGVSSATWQANYTAIFNYLTAIGCNVIFCTPAPSNSGNASAIRTWLFANYPNNTIDTYTPFLGSGTSLNAAYNTDGTHLNGAGHLLWATTVTQSNK